jgi:hypothetical protein
MNVIPIDYAALIIMAYLSSPWLRMTIRSMDSMQTAHISPITHISTFTLTSQDCINKTMKTHEVLSAAVSSPWVFSMINEDNMRFRIRTIRISLTDRFRTLTLITPLQDRKSHGRRSQDHCRAQPEAQVLAHLQVDLQEELQEVWLAEYYRQLQV